MTPTIYRVAKMKFKMYSMSGDGRKEHNPPHIHIIYKNNEVTFPVVNRKLSEKDLKVKSGRLQDNMLEFAQLLLSEHYKELEEMWKTQHFYEIVD